MTARAPHGCTHVTRAVQRVVQLDGGGFGYALLHLMYARNTRVKEQ